MFNDAFVKMAAGAIARTAIAALAGHGLLSANETEQAVSALGVLLVGLWSVYQKWDAHQQITGAK